MNKGGKTALIGSLAAAHIWGSILIWAVMDGRESLIIAEMFNAIGFMIFSTLGVLVGGKAWETFAPLKWGHPNQTISVTETQIQGVANETSPGMESDPRKKARKSSKRN